MWVVEAFMTLNYD